MVVEEYYLPTDYATIGSTNHKLTQNSNAYIRGKQYIKLENSRINMIKLLAWLLLLKRWLRITLVSKALVGT